MSLRFPLLGVGAMAALTLLLAGGSHAQPAGLERAPAVGGAERLVPVLPAPVVVRPWRPDPAVTAQGEALHQHLKDLGIPADAAAGILTRIEGAAQQRFVPDADLVTVAGLAADAEASDKALEMLRAYAELVTWGEPRSGDLAVQGMPRVPGGGWLKELAPGEIELPEIDPELPETRVGGTCRVCPDYDYGPFTPAAAYQFHSSSILGGFNDCAWYAFNVIVGHRYEFSICSPGSATWDSVMEVYDPANCPTFLARQDDCAPPAQRQSALFWDATFTGVAHVKLRGFSSASGGPYTMAYRSLGIVCETCVNPGPALAAPTAISQCVSRATTATCTSHFMTVNLTAGETYQFTTCPANAAAATANYDTLLRLWTPSCGIAVSNDDSCSTTGMTTRSTLSYTATTTGPHRIEVTGRMLSNGTILSGSYTLCYRRTSAACAACTTGPYLGTFTPLPSCQTHSSNVTACQDSWYQFVLSGGVEYEFTTCSIAGACLGGAADFDTVLDLHSSGCVLVSSNDDGCGGTGSRLTYDVPAGMGGVYKLLVRGKSGATGNYTLTYREVTQACVPPSSASVGPLLGSTGSSNCVRTETFTLGVDAAATLPVTYAWSITPPPGGVAAPPSGTVTSAAPGGAASFTTTLSGEGAYQVSVTVTNACGSITHSAPYVLVDAVRPVVTAPPSSTVECDAVPTPEDPTVRDNCDPAPGVSMVEVLTPGTCPGNVTIRRTWVAEDRAGNVSNPAVQVIVVRDRTPPTLSSDTSVKHCVYPPNHDVVCFDRTMFSPTVEDNCSLPATWRFVRVTSSEEGLSPCGSGNQDPDVFVSADGETFCVRSERCGNDPAENDGRRYLVEAAATDACGNTSDPMPIGYILVPHDTGDTDGCLYPTPIPLP